MKERRKGESVQTYRKEEREREKGRVRERERETDRQTDRGGGREIVEWAFTQRKRKRRKRIETEKERKGREMLKETKRGERNRGHGNFPYNDFLLITLINVRLHMCIFYC